MPPPSNVMRPKLYERVKARADKIYRRPTSAYKSMWIAKEYKRLGGTYSGTRGASTNRWRKERWIQVIPYVRNKKIVECGASNAHGKTCRPLVRVTKDTPLTIDEVVKLLGAKKVIALARKKNTEMAGRIYWARGVFTPPRK